MSCRTVERRVILAVTRLEPWRKYPSYMYWPQVLDYAATYVWVSLWVWGSFIEGSEGVPSDPVKLCFFVLVVYGFGAYVIR